jgi:RimJ/RimL family protein N-acetyltransferase
LIQIKHQHGRIILFREGTVPAEQFAGSKRPGTISMSGAADYSVVEHLRGGRPIEIRALRPDDKAEMLAAIGRTSTQSLQRRFFAPKKGFSEQEMAFFLNIDFETHVALIAQIDEDGRTAIAGGGRYIVVRPGQAEIAFVVVDAYQGQGIGTMLMRHLAVLARDAGLKELIAEVLPENTAMLKVFKKFGFRPGSKREPQVIHLTLQLA